MRKRSIVTIVFLVVGALAVDVVAVVAVTNPTAHKSTVVQAASKAPDPGLVASPTTSSSLPPVEPASTTPPTTATRRTTPIVITTTTLGGDVQLRQSACAAFEISIADATQRAQAINAGLDQSKLAHPYRPVDVWTPTDENRATAAIATLEGSKSTTTVRLHTTMKTATDALIPGSNVGASQSELALAEVEYSCT